MEYEFNYGVISNSQLVRIIIKLIALRIFRYFGFNLFCVLLDKVKQKILIDEYLTFANYSNYAMQTLVTVSDSVTC